MLGSQAFPFINGAAPSWADIKVSLSPPRPVGGLGAVAGAATAVAAAAGASFLTMQMLQAINTGVQVEVDDVRGASGGRVLARTTGEQSQTCSLTFYSTGFDDFLFKIGTIAPLRGAQRRVSLVSFDIDYQYKMPGEVALKGTRIRGCRYLGRERNDSQGNAAALVTVPISCVSIVDVVNGIEHSAL